MVGDQSCGHGIDAGGIGKIKLDGGHSGIGLDDLVKMGAPSAGDDDLVATRVKRFGEAAADA